MTLMPIIYVTNMERSVAFYESIGASLGSGGVRPHWTEMTLGGTPFALHIATGVDPSGDPQGGVSMRARQSLETIIERLRAAGVEPVRDITEEPFGRSLAIGDPDGLVIQINEHEGEPAGA